MRVTAKICEISNLKACQKFLDFSDVVIHSVHIFQTFNHQERGVDGNLANVRRTISKSMR